MSSPEELKVENWIRRQVIKTHYKSGKTILPVKEKIKKIQVVSAKNNVLDQINQCCDLFTLLNYDIVVFYFKSKITQKELTTICNKAHNKNKHMSITPHMLKKQCILLLTNK